MPWWNNDWNYRLKISVGSVFVNTTLSGVPLWVRLRDDNFDFTRTTVSGGEEIRFTDSSETLIPHEITQWDTASGIGDIWVKFPEISSTEDSYVWMYYGNSTPSGVTISGTEVWSDYELVYHLNESVLDGTSGQVLDSSPAGNHGTSTGHPTPEQAGIIGSSIYCDGSDYITSTSNSTLTGSSSRTTVLWFKPTVANQGTWAGMFSYGIGAIDQSWFIQAAMNGADFYSFLSWGSFGDTETWIGVDPAEGWNHWALNYDGINWKGFYNGNLISDRTDRTLNTGASAYYIGRDYYNSANCQGYLDEVRMATKTLSDEEIKVQYLNMAEHSKIMSYEDADYGGPDSAGYAKVNETLTSGIVVRLYRRSDGSLIGEDVTAVSGTFNIPTTYDEDHYAVALYTTSGTNALIYDWLHPTLNP